MLPFLPRPFVITAIIGCLCIAGVGQKVEPQRAVLQRMNPQYPELARRSQISGNVKLEMVVLPNGRVKTVSVVGGNPVLAEAAAAAVTRWKFMPTNNVTTERVEIRFHPD
jgi:TonB family protein